ncbi:MAG: FkbM family methyltransferase [Verrucomicrobia bacterium]|nr:FkbM family methyltransferase [Verrucomicrobiota bacterium]
MNLRQLPHRLLKSLGYRIFRSDTFYDSFIYYNRWGFPPDSLLRHIADASKIKTCIDAGANHGQTAIFLTDAFPGANIYSFEPVRSTFEILQTKVSHLPHVRTFNVALGESKGHVEIMRTEDDKRSSIVASTTDGSKQQAELVEVKTLDQFMQENGIQQVNWLKTDTEGYDLHVLKGAKEALSQGICKTPTSMTCSRTSTATAISSSVSTIRLSWMPHPGWNMPMRFSSAVRRPLPTPGDERQKCALAIFSLSQ